MGQLNHPHGMCMHGLYLTYTKFNDDFKINICSVLVLSMWIVTLTAL